MNQTCKTLEKWLKQLEKTIQPAARKAVVPRGIKAYKKVAAIR